MCDAPAHASGAARGRAEIPGRAGGPVRDSGDRGRRALWGGPSDGAPVDVALPGCGNRGAGGPFACAEAASVADTRSGGGGDLRVAPGASPVGPAPSGVRAGPPRVSGLVPLDGLPGAGPSLADRAGAAPPAP